MTSVGGEGDKKGGPDGSGGKPDGKGDVAEEENRLDLLQWYLEMIIDTEPEKKDK